MTPEQFAAAMRQIAVPGGDTEGAHSEADELMARVLEELGYGEGVQIFREMDRWYA